MLQPNPPSSANILLLHRPEARLRLPRPAGPRNRLKPSIIPEPIIACMVEARRPTQQEIVAVAAKIWRDWNGKAAPAWEDVSPGSQAHRMMMAAARFALGNGPNVEMPASPRRGEPWVWWRGGSRDRAGT